MKRRPLVKTALFQAGVFLIMLSGSCLGAETYAWADVTGTLRVNPNSVNGTATFLAFGRRIPMTYTLDASNVFNASGSWSAGTTGWKALPNVPGVEYRVTTPRIAVSVSSSPAALNAILTIGQIEVQTTTKKPDGTPWSQQKRLISGQLRISFSGDVTLDLPALPAPQAIVDEPWCDASCGFLQNVTLPGTAVRFDGTIAVPHGTVFPTGRLDYVDRWHSQCEIHRLNSRLQDEGTGECKRDSICLPGRNRVQGSDPARCIEPVPTIPTLPGSITVNIETLLQ